MYIYIYIYIYIYTYIHTYIHTSIHTYIHTYTHIHTHTHTHIYKHIHIHTYIHTYIHIYIYIILCVTILYLLVGEHYSDVYKTPRDGGTTFTVIHYAGAIPYHVDGILDKNRDTLRQALSFTVRCKCKVLFNDALNTFYLPLYGFRHMVKDHSDSERGNPLLPHMHHPTDRITHTTAFVTPAVEHWLERKIAQWVHHEGSIR